MQERGNKRTQNSIAKVNAVLKKLADPKDFQIQMIFNILENYLRKKGMNLSEVIPKLLRDFDNNNYLSHISTIELFSAALNKECDYAFSRIQSR